MKNFEIYNDIAERTGGDIYIGIVGPVRTGKSTFISRFMQSSILDNITSAHEKQRAIDEMPQSGAGKTIMTMQPKFVPNEAVSVKFENGTNAKIRLIDCVGYAIEGAQGFEDDGSPRMVKTPWSEDEMTFTEAAEIGTRKVITEHSTIAVLVTTDGTIADISRENYVKSEERVVKELNENCISYIFDRSENRRFLWKALKYIMILQNEQMEIFMLVLLVLLEQASQHLSQSLWNRQY